MTNKLHARRILITGAASGMGRGIAESFATERAALALLPGFLVMEPLETLGGYAARLAGASVAVKTRADAGMLHGYLSAAGAIACAAEAVREAAVWIEQRVREANA